MPDDPRLADFPILTELGEQLDAGFRRRAARRLPPVRNCLVVAATVAFAIGIALAVGLQEQGLSPSEASAAATLRDAAGAADAQPAVLVKPRQYFYVRWLTSALIPVRKNPSTPLPRSSIGVPRASVSVEAWEFWSPTRVGRIDGRVLGVAFPNDAAQSRWQRLGRPPLSTAVLGSVPSAISPLGETIPVGRSSLTARQLLALPSNPRAIYRHLFAAGTAYGALDLVRSLDVYPIRPMLRAALYRALALVPGIVSVGKAVTLTGRVGTAIGAQDPDRAVRDELIIDPHNGDLLGSRIVVINVHAENLPRGTVISQTAIVQSTVTNSLSQPK
jgi:hypothetical protein